MHSVPEVLLTYNMTQHVDYPGGFTIAEVAVEDDFILRILNPDSALSPVGFPDHVFMKRFFPQPVFEVEGFTVGCPSFIEPDMMKCITGEFIAKPLMREFMRYHPVVVKSHGTAGLVLHGSTPEVLGMSVLFISKRIAAVEI